MPKDITKEIEDMADKVEKATVDPTAKLFKTIETLGKSGIKERLPLLNEEEKVLLKAVLEEMHKAKSIEFDKEATGAKVIHGNIMDSILQEEKGDDEEDEKLVKPEAAKHSHQGNSVEGWDGQVVKAGAFKKLEGELKDEKGVKDPAGLAAEIGRKKMGKEAFDKKVAAGHKKVMKKGEDGIDEEDNKDYKSEEEQQKKETAKVAITKRGKNTVNKSLTEIYEEIKKSEDVIVKAIMRGSERGMKNEDMAAKLEEKGMPAKKAKKLIKKAMKKMGKEDAAEELMEMEEKEHGTKDPKKLVEAEKKEQKDKKMKKGESEHDSGTILAEEDQLGDTAQMTEEGKDLGDETQDAAKANKKTQKDVNNVKMPSENMKKSVSWGSDEDRIKVGTQGRNFSFNVGDFVEEMLKSEKVDKNMKSKEDKEDERIRKESEKQEKPMKKADLNDLIEKSMDTTWFAEDIKKSLEDAQLAQTGTLVKSFGDQDIATILGLTEEEAKKILG